jgi:hypothetical protein
VLNEGIKACSVHFYLAIVLHCQSSSSVVEQQQQQQQQPPLLHLPLLAAVPRLPVLVQLLRALVAVFPPGQQRGAAA